MGTPEEVKPDPDESRVDRALADIERYRQEIQTAPSERSGIADLLAETQRCHLLTEFKINNVIAETEALREAAKKPVEASVSQPQPATALGVDQMTISSERQKSSEDEDNVLTPKRKKKKAGKRAQREAEFAAKQALGRQEMRSLGRWQLFIVGFGFGALCFVVAVMLSRFFGYPSSGPIVFWLCLLPTATIVLLRRSGFGDVQKEPPPDVPNLISSAS
jgi:hypothetical protein